MVTAGLNPLRWTSLFLASVASLGLVSCTGKATQRTVHEKGLVTDNGPRLNPEEAQNEVQKVYSKSGTADQVISNKSATTEQVLAATLDLSKTVLNESILENTTLSGTPEFRSIITTMNRGIVRLLQENPKALKDSGLLQNYKNAVFAGCDDTLELSNCHQLAIFRENNGSLILTAIALNYKEEILRDRSLRSTGAAAQTRYLKNVESFYHTLTAAYEITNQVANDQINLAYVQMSQDYYNYLASQPQDKRIADLKRRHNTNLNMALTRIRDRLAKSTGSKQFCEYIVGMDPLHFQISTESTIDRRTMRFMVQEYIECTGNAKGPESLQATIKNLLNLETQDQAKKYAAEKAQMQNTKELISAVDNGFGYARAAVLENNKIAKNLDIKSSIEANDIARFVIDRLFYQKIDQAMARLYWNKISNQADKSILDYVRNYARTQMAYELKTTWQNYGRILTQEFAKRGGIGTGFYDDVIQRTNNQSQQSWDLFGNRMRILSDFLKQAYDSEKKNIKFYNEVRRLLSDLESVNDRVQFTELKNYVQPAHYDHMGVAVVSPLTMALYYYMAKSQGTIKIFIPWWPSNDQTFSINGQSSLHDYLSYNGDIEFQFFKLGSAQYKMDHLSKLHALNFALRSGFFEYVPFDLLDEDKNNRPFAASEVEANNQFLFFQQAFKDVFRYWEASFNSAIKNIDIVTRDQNFSQRFLDMCKDPLRAQINYDRIDSLKVGTLFEEQNLFKGVQSIYDTGRFMAGWREDRDKIRSYIEVINVHYKNNLGVAESSVVAKIKAEMDRFEKLEKSFYQKMFSLDKMIVSKNDDCLMRLQKAEKLRTDIVLKENINYYKNVHAAMTLLKITAGQNGDSVNTLASTIAAWANANKSTANADVAARMQKLAATITTYGLNGLRATNLQEALQKVLGIHNMNIAPFVAQSSELGFFVTGVDLWNKDGDILLSSKNSISADQFAQSPWDTLVRLRRQLQTTYVDHRVANEVLGTQYSQPIPLAAGLEIPLGSFADLEQTGSLYLNNTTLKVPYNVDQNVFVQQSMIQLAGNQGGNYQSFVSWRSEGRQAPALFNKRFTWLREISKLGTIELGTNDQANCPKNAFGLVQATRDIYGDSTGLGPVDNRCQAVQVTPKNILETLIQLGQYLKLSEQDRTLLDWLDLRTLNSSLINTYFTYSDLDKETTAKWTWFDKFYRSKLVSVTSYTPDGQVVYVESLRGKEDFIQYNDSYLLNIRSGRNLLPLQADPTQIERNLIRQKVFDHMKEIRIYDREIEKIENTRDLGEIVFESQITKNAQEKYKYGNWRYIAVNKRTSGPRAGTPIYLEDKERTKEWYSGFLTEFFKKEGCAALPQAGDPDVALVTENQQTVVDLTKDCEVRFKYWKKNLETLP